MKYIIALILLAGPVFAQDGPTTFSLPQGCDAFLTVQSKTCQVDHHFVCEGDPEGHQRRVGITEEGLTYAGEIDSETQWINSFHARTGHSETLESNPAERASFSDLIQKGVDDYDFRTESPQIGNTRYVGQDTLTGRQIVIDGVTLDETTFDITAYDENGDVIWAAKGNEFVNQDWRIFLSGTGVTSVGSERFESDDSPVEFIFPGEPGFLSARPKYGCGVAISHSDILKENTHDNL